MGGPARSSAGCGWIKSHDRRPNLDEMVVAGHLLWQAAEGHGMSKPAPRRGGGELVVEVADDRTYSHVVGLEGEVEARLGWRPAVGRC